VIRAVFEHFHDLSPASPSRTLLRKVLSGLNQRRLMEAINRLWYDVTIHDVFQEDHSLVLLARHNRRQQKPCYVSRLGH